MTLGALSPWGAQVTGVPTNRTIEEKGSSCAQTEEPALSTMEQLFAGSLARVGASTAHMYSDPTAARSTHPPPIVRARAVPLA